MTNIIKVYLGRFLELWEPKDNLFSSLDDLNTNTLLFDDEDQDITLGYLDNIVNGKEVTTNGTLTLLAYLINNKEFDELVMDIASLYEIESNKITVYDKVTENLKLDFYAIIYKIWKKDYKHFDGTINCTYSILRPDVLKYLTNKNMEYKPLTEEYSFEIDNNICKWKKNIE